MIAALLSSMFPGRDVGRPRNADQSSRVVGLDTRDGWERLGESDAGVPVTHHTALTLAPVWQAVSLISGDLAIMTLDCYRRLPGDDREIAADHPAEPLVSVQANDHTSAFEFWRRCAAQAALWGSGYAYIERQGGRFGPPTGLINLLPDRTHPRYSDAGELFYLTEVDGRLEPLYAEEVLHVKGLSVSNGCALDLVWYARNAIGLALAAEGYASKFYAHGSQVGGVLTVPATFSEKAAQKLEEGWRNRYAGKENWFKTLVLRDGAKFDAVTMDAQRAQQHELREDQVRDVARFFNLPPFKLGLADSVSYNSSEQGQIAYLTSCLNHWRMAISSECGMKLLTREERQKTHYFEHNPTVLLEMDSKSLNEVLEIQIRSEIICPAEARRKLNLGKRLDGGGTEYRNPNNAVTEAAPAEPADLLDVPDRRQEPIPYACGAAAVWSVADYFEVGGARKLRDYCRELGTKPATGTAPDAMVDWFHRAGLVCTSGQGLAIDDLGRFTAAGQPVIAAVQMYNGGHYVVVLGVGMGQVFFQDPVAGRRMLPADEFDTLWHDTEADGDKADHFGVAVGASLVAPPEADPTETPDGTETPVVPDDAAASAVAAGDVQATALNGAQVVSLVGVLDKLAQGQWPEGTTEAAIRAAFPGTPDELIQAMIASLRNFTPRAAPAPEPVAPAPAPPTETDA